MDEILVRQLVRDEGLRLKPYRCTAGKLTIGVGRNLDDVGLTRDEAMYLLSNDIARTEDELVVALPWYSDLDLPRRRAILNMGFNLGLSRLLQFRKALQAARAKSWEAAASEALDSAWARQVGDRATRIARTLRTGQDN